MQNEEIVQSKGVLEVMTIAAEYCRFIDKIGGQDVYEVMGFLQKILPALYLKGSLFPNIEVTDDSANERFVTEEEYETLRCRLTQFFGDKDYFTTVNPESDNTESTPISISELLCDIYLDLKDFLILYAKGSQCAKENAIANCYCYFHTGWGMRLTLLLPQLHHLIAQNTYKAYDE